MILSIMYFLGASLIWIGSIAQLKRLYRCKHSNDISIMFMSSILLAHSMMLPRTIDSGIGIWMGCHAISTLFALIVLMTVLYYRNPNEK